LVTYYAKKNIKTIVDFGCGKCDYITKLHDVDGYDTQGYDGSPFSNNSIVAQMDLSQEVKLGKTYDYVQSFEVGEHIFQIFENNFIGNIGRHAQKGIVMSWSVIGQSGYMHINNRNNDYIISKV
jgi:hypothetical protein